MSLTDVQIANIYDEHKAKLLLLARAIMSDNDEQWTRRALVELFLELRE